MKYNYLVNINGKPIYIDADYVYITKGHLVFWGKNNKMKKYYPLSDVVHFDDLGNFDRKAVIEKTYKKFTEDMEKEIAT
jgi:hypothetical protein